MTIQLKTNSSASAAAFHLARNTQNLQKSLNRLASGSRIIQPADDTGGLAVSMKLQSSISRLEGAKHNAQNGVSFLEVQDGLLAFGGRILDRMAELKGLSSQDPMKSSLDQASYNDEFKDLQVQLFEMSQQTFNGVSLFAQFATDNATGLVNTTEVQFRGTNTQDNTLTIFTSSDGNDGSKVSLSKSALLSALTINAGNLNASLYNGTTNTANGINAAAKYTFASARVEDTMDCLLYTSPSPRDGLLSRMPSCA